MESLTEDQIRAAGLDAWRIRDGALRSRFATGSFVAGLRFVTAITDAAEQANHHPDVTLTYPAVDLSLVSHDVDAITQRDLDLAQRIDDIAREQGIEAETVIDTDD